MITSLNFSLFPSNELLTFAKGTISVAEAKKTQLPVIVPFLSNVTLKCGVYQSALEREQKNPLTKLQISKDEIRNDAFTAFRSYGEYAESRRKDSWNVAAVAILSVIRKHGWSAQTWGYKAKSAAFTNIISELKSKYTTELKLIGADELLNELAAAQTDFEDAAKQVVESASVTHEPTVSETRPELVIAIKALFQIVSLQEISAPSADVAALISSLNELITTSLSTVKATGTRAENNKKKTTDDTTK